MWLNFSFEQKFFNLCLYGFCCIIATSFSDHFLITTTYLFFNIKVSFVNIYVDQIFYLSIFQIFISKICCYEFLVHLSGDVQLKLGSKSKWYKSFMIWHWNSVCNFMEVFQRPFSMLHAYLKCILIQINLKQ